MPITVHSAAAVPAPSWRMIPSTSRCSPSTVCRCIVNVFEPRIVTEQFDDRTQALRQRIAHIGKRFKHIDVMTGRSEQISDAVAHEATADHADFLLCVFVHLFPRANKPPELR